MVKTALVDDSRKSFEKRLISPVQVNDRLGLKLNVGMKGWRKRDENIVINVMSALGYVKLTSHLQKLQKESPSVIQMET